MEELLETMRRVILPRANGAVPESPLPRIGYGSTTQPTSFAATTYEPMVCMVLQGAKQVTIGDRVLRYDTACCFAASLELPASGRIIEASPEKPYIAVSLKLDRTILAELLAEVPGEAEGSPTGFAVSLVTRELLEAWSHLLALLDRPQDIRVLAPLRERELLYRLLQGPGGGMLRAIARDDSRLSQVRRAIDWLRANYDAPVRVETLAEMAGMSVPSFHRHFKSATAMSPLQYQKTLRLHAARRLLATNAEASRAAYSVGYESASQFSREYARMFGAPPSRDAERLRAVTAEAVAAP